MRLSSPQQGTNRDEILALYRPMRESIQRITGAGVRACGTAALDRAARQLGWRDYDDVLDDTAEPGPVEMVCDIALFEPNQRGRRTIDRLIAQPSPTLSPDDIALAKRMAGARFSLFRCLGLHEAAGVWLEDLLEENRRIWLMDEKMEQVEAPLHAGFGMRIFDAGPFHAGFGLVAFASPELISLASGFAEQREPMRFRHSLAAECYLDTIVPDITAEMEEEFIDMLSDLLASTKARARTSPSAAAKRGRR
jgi:hypothetical protein